MEDETSLELPWLCNNFVERKGSKEKKQRRGLVWVEGKGGGRPNTPNAAFRQKQYCYAQACQNGVPVPTLSIVSRDFHFARGSSIAGLHFHTFSLVIKKNDVV